MKTSLTVIDAQNDFVDPQGSLFVPGSQNDIARITKFIRANITAINQLCETYDTHQEFQVFHPGVWIGGPQNERPGEHPKPFTQISLEQLDNEYWIYVGEWPDEVHEMFVKKSKTRKPDLTIWPLHCILGTWGHNLHPDIKGIFSDHYYVTNHAPLHIQKGECPFTEHHGAVRAEVIFKSDPSTHENSKLLAFWKNHDINIITGEASSHCVLETLEHIEENFANLAKFVIFTDCMSSVPDIQNDVGDVIVSFKKITAARFEELSARGMKFMKSTDFKFE